MPRYVVVYQSSPPNFFYGRLRGHAPCSAQLVDARVYDGPRYTDGETPIAVAFRLASAGPTDAKASARVPRLVVGTSPHDIILDVTPGARLAWEGANRVDLKLVGCGPNRIAVIKAIREVTGLGLKEAKDLADLSAESPSTVMSRVAPEVAAAAHKNLREAGAIVRVDPSAEGASS